VGLIQGGERGRFAMPIPLRADFDAPMVRAAAKRSKDGPQARRLLALAAIYEGASRTEAAKIGGVRLQIVRDWVIKFNAHGPEGLIDRKPPGPRSRLNGAHRAALATILQRPDPGRAWRRALADHRSLPMDLRGIPRRRRQADIEPGIARHGIS
jgi:transposase